MSNYSDKVYFITGCSKGLGLEVVIQLLKSGMKVVATSRDTNQMIQEIKSVDESLINDNNLLALKMDLTCEQSIKTAVDEAIKKFKYIYAVINNAGYGLSGTVEELSLTEIRKQFEINVFGVITVLHYIIPNLRLRHYADPRIINIGSIAGFNAEFASYSIYCSTKFALAGLSEGLAYDLKEFGVKVTVVYLGSFRTQFHESTSKPQNKMEEYTEVRKMDRIFAERAGKQIGDPVKAAKALVQLSLDINPALDLFLGSTSVRIAEEKIKKLQSQIDSNRDFCNNTDFTS
ncbi:short-chain dehydrogenase/reductase (SDR) family protein [Tieghemostelium lacteum]|uniref:Short-chain dehydrogenase/reductase (SDR) family protein n=1 Tax=Tieghemostelium lacteum TaxID=361077 RepID=A0A151ZF08_TIELA|nr:short-chain dehydrogenase/reductase (SDR) family protein [Tieghemostelium lacteum]|eukprot:KYQ92499.1 short-chain dehydrogenase/reductase (SDR) family protein [Tieghemostelium lacteum]